MFLFALTFTFIPNLLHAADGCSSYIGQASLNEFFKDNANQINDVNDYAEVKILNNAITPAIYNDWQIYICEQDTGTNNSGNDCTPSPIKLSDFTDTTIPWLILRDGNIGNYINTKTGYDAVLLDSEGKLIDYLTVGSYSKAIDQVLNLSGFTCPLSNLVYDYEFGAPGASDKSNYRTPDGIGEWGKTSAASDPGTSDDTNDVLPPPPPGQNYPFIRINNVNVNVGETANFIVELVDSTGSITSFSQDITFSYFTSDGTATVADNDYAAVPLTPTVTITIPAGQSSGSISISVANSDFYDIGETFYTILNSVITGNAIISGNTGVATLDGTGCSFSTTGIFAGTEIDVDDNNIIFNNGSTQSTLVQGTTTTNNSILLDGSIINQPINLPVLPAISWVNSPDPSLTNGDALPTASGVYDYDRLTIANNATITIAAGTYNIDQFLIGQNVTINVTGKVTINTNEFLYSGGGNGSININTPGDPSNFTVNLYNDHNAEFDLGDNSNFTGIIYSSFSNTNIEIDDDNSIVGGIFTEGEVQLKDGSTIVYNDSARAAAFSTIGCLPIRIRPTVDPQVTPNPTPTVTGTYDSSDAGGGLTVTINGTTYTTSTGLITSGDTWSLTVSTPLLNGVYDVVVTSTNGSGNIISDTTTDELTIGSASCFSDTYPIFAGEQLDIENITFINNTGGSSNPTQGQTNQSALNTSGIVSNQSPTLSPLPAISWVNSPDPNLTNGQTLSPGDYDRVRVTNNATIFLQPGIYNIDEFNLRSNVTIIISPVGKVVINTNEFTADGGAIINYEVDTSTNPDTITAHDPGNLLVNIYNNHNAEFDLGDDSFFSGIVYSSFSNTQIEVDDDNTFTGAIITNGDVDLKDGSSITFSTNAKAAAASVLGCNVNPFDHFSINYADGASGTGINCQASTITIEAHDDNHQPILDYVGTINLSTKTKAAATSFGDWSNTLTPTDAYSVVSPIGADAGAATYEFVLADEGQISLSFKNTHTEITELNVSESTFSEKSNNAVLIDDFEIDFAASGFNFLADTVKDAIGLQIGGKPSNVLPGSQSLELQAVKTNTTTGACESALQGPQTIELAFECTNPSSCTNNNLEISFDNGLTYEPAIFANNSGTSPLSYSTVTGFDFGNAADTTASFVMRYNDVGSIKLHARKIIAPSNEQILGTSTNFVARPFAFYISVPSNPAAASAGDSPFTIAGKDFTVNLNAVLWQSEDDAAVSDGIADGHADTDPTNNANLLNNPVALNYGQEIIPNNAPATSTEQVVLSANLFLPNPGTHPGLDDSSANNNRITSFNSTTGIGTTTTLNYDEVGIIELHSSVSDNNYLDIGSAETAKIIGASGYVGRFYPNHFDTSVIEGCTINNNYTYSGQPISVTALARNTSGLPTVNYTGGFAYTTTLSNAAVSPIINFTNNTIPAINFVNGIGTRTDVIYTYPNKDTPPTTITLRANDADTGSSVGIAEGTTQIRSGRIRLENVFGSELLPLTMPLRAEYFSDNGTASTTDDGYILNSDDSCSAYDAATATLASYSGNLSNGEVAVTGMGSLALGAATVVFHKPGDITLGPGLTNDGSVNLLLNTADWLEYDWTIDCDGDSNNDSDPCGIASFGLYRGDDRVIYWREVF